MQVQLREGRDELLEEVPDQVVTQSLAGFDQSEEFAVLRVRHHVVADVLLPLDDPRLGRLADGLLVEGQTLKLSLNVPTGVRAAGTLPCAHDLLDDGPVEARVLDAHHVAQLELLALGEDLHLRQKAL